MVQYHSTKVLPVPTGNTTPVHRILMIIVTPPGLGWRWSGFVPHLFNSLHQLLPSSLLPMASLKKNRLHWASSLQPGHSEYFTTAQGVVTMMSIPYTGQVRHTEMKWFSQEPMKQRQSQIQKPGLQLSRSPPLPAYTQKQVEMFETKLCAESNEEVVFPLTIVINLPSLAGEGLITHYYYFKADLFSRKGVSPCTSLLFLPLIWPSCVKCQSEFS